MSISENNEIILTVLPGNEKVLARKGERLFEALAKNGFFVNADCGGRGVCGKCRVRLVNGEVDGVAPDDNGYVPSCRATIKSSLTVELLTKNEARHIVVEKGKAAKTTVALDLGTTMLVAALVDGSNGKIIETASVLNPQASFGADVISRIQACKNGYGRLLQSLVVKGIRVLLEKLSGNEITEELTVCANTTMLHILAGESPVSLGEYPFAPVFTEEKELDGADLGLPVKRVRLLPSVSAYIGSDVISGIVHTKMYADAKTSILVDLGTNGEIVLAVGGRLYAASTAAGPAFEGACIECGLGGTSGAINRVSVIDGEITFATIDGKEPIGICGSGLIDAVAVMLDERIIDESGAFSDNVSPRHEDRIRNGRFYLCNEVYVSQKDVRELQMAKAAIVAGVRTLLATVNVSEEVVDALYLAGGLGEHLNVKSAARIGLIPTSLVEKTEAVGNAALYGACKAACYEEAHQAVCLVSKKTQTIELSLSEEFSERYINEMIFKKE